MQLLHFPGFLTAYRSCDCVEKKLVALDLGWLSKVLMRSSGSSKVAMAAGLQGLFCFLLTQAWAVQQPVQSSEQQEKISSGSLNCFDFTGFFPKPGWPIFLPSTTLPPFSPTELTVPTPKYVYSYITSKYTLATLKTLVLRKHLVSYLEGRWECLSCTLL